MMKNGIEEIKCGDHEPEEKSEAKDWALLLQPDLVSRTGSLGAL